MSDVKAHPDSEALARFLLGKLDPVEQAELERHVGECQSCCFVLQGVRDDTLVGRLRWATGATASAGASTPIDASKANQSPAADPASEVPAELKEHPRYRIVKLLGTGGMGVVYQAEHKLMERHVAIKVIGKEFINHPTAVERFRQEVKAAARLSHVNIVAAHDAEQAGELHFLVMEYVDGVSLDRLVERRGPLPVPHACNYIRQAALGLQHASERGMVHRDIKPHNLMVTRKGQVKILDFGLARFARETSQAELDLDQNAGRKKPALTAHGTVLGTPDYIAPEQADDPRKADIRADLYSLGCTLYFALSGRVPFPKGNAVEKLMQHSLERPTPLAELRPELPAELVHVVERLMAKDPGNRFQSPVEAVQALTPFARQQASVPAALPLAAETPFHSSGGFPRKRTHRRARRTQLPVALSPAFLIPVAAALLVAIGLWAVLANWAKRDPGEPNPPDGKPSEVAQSEKKATGPTPGTPEGKPSSAEKKQAFGGPRALLVLPAHGFWHEEYGPVRRTLETGGVRVQVASTETLAKADAFNKSGGNPVQPDVLLKDVRAADYDAVVFLGGAGAQEFYSDWADKPNGQLAGRLLNDMLGQGKWVAGIGYGSDVLAGAGILKGKRAVGVKDAPARLPCSAQRLERLGASWVDAPFVVDGKIITGRDTADVEAFARELMKQLREMPAEEAKPRLTTPDGKRTGRVLMVLASKDFWYVDYISPRSVLQKRGFRVAVASSTREPCIPDPRHPDQPQPVRPDLLLSEAKAEDYDAVIFCGGKGVLQEYCSGQPHAAHAQRLIRDMLAADKWVTAVCGGPAILADAGALRGKRATCYPYQDGAYEERLLAGGATLVKEQDVVEDGRILTGRDPSSAVAFGLALAERLKSAP